MIGSAGGNYASGVLTITLPEHPVQPGSVNVDITVQYEGDISHHYTVVDDGAGGVSASAWGGSVSGSTEGFEPGAPNNLPAISATVPALAGTIDYVLGAITLSIGSLKGSKTVQDYIKMISPPAL